MGSPTAIIIGAGLAGLETALNLHRAGWATTVLEARHRVGGRVFSLHDGFREGQHAEGGGELIDGFHERMIARANEFGLPLETAGGMRAWGRWLALEGSVGSGSDSALWGADLSAELRAIWTELANLGKHVPDPSQPHTAPDAARLDAQSAADWLESLPAHPLAKTAFTSGLRSEYLVEPEDFSLLELARWGSYYYSDPGGDETTYRITGGNDQLPKAMANALPDVRLGVRVTRIAQSESGVIVTSQTGESAASLTADYAVLAIPLGPARDIAFDPLLPSPHQAMLDGLSYGTVTKVLIQYRGPFWGDRDWNGTLLTDLPFTCAWESTLGHQETETRILTVYTGANRGMEFTAMPDEDRIATAVAQIEQVFPGSAQRVIAARTVAWRSEPFTQGGYLIFKPGDVTAHWQTLHQPVDRLYFAGEHTAVNQGYMEGALESGERVSGELLARVGT